MAKTGRFTWRNVDLERLATRIETHLLESNFEVAFSKDPGEPARWFFIQARRTSKLRTVIGARRSTDITISGEPNSFEVAIRTGEWGKNMLMSAPLFVVPAVGVASTVVRFYEGWRFESDLWKYIRDQIGFLTNRTHESAVAQLDARTYDCDYVKGYPGWRAQVAGGKLLLEKQRDGKNRIVFKVDSREIVIPAERVSHAQILARKKGLHQNDLMIQITCKDPRGRTIRPVFNLNDDIINGVLAGVTEIVGEEKVLREIEHANVITQVKLCVYCGAQIQKTAKFCPDCGIPQQR